MIKKVLFIGDIQSDDRTPKTRKDDYLLTILTKLEESLNIAKDKKVDAVILLGDVFDRVDPPGRCRNAIIGLFMPYKDLFPIYVVVGNHDIKSSMANYPNSALATLVDTGIIKLTNEIDELGIKLGHFTPTIEEDIKNGVFSGLEAFIWAFHANLANVGMPFEHVLFKNTKWHENCKLVVSGHLHKQMTDEKDGVKFINPGSIIRDELSEYNLKHIPTILYVEYELNKRIITTDLIELKSAQPAEDVFYIEQMQDKKDIVADTQQYIQQISTMNMWVAGPNKYESLRKSAQIKNVEPDVVDLAIKTLQEVNSK